MDAEFKNFEMFSQTMHLLHEILPLTQNLTLKLQGTMLLRHVLVTFINLLL